MGRGNGWQQQQGGSAQKSTEQTNLFCGVEVLATKQETEMSARWRHVNVFGPDRLTKKTLKTDNHIQL